MTKDEMFKNAYYHKSFDGTLAFDDLQVMCMFFKITSEELKNNFGRYFRRFFKESGFLLYFNESDLQNDYDYYLSW